VETAIKTESGKRIIENGRWKTNVTFHSSFFHFPFLTNMKQLSSSLVLLLVVAVVGGWIYFNERGPIADAGSTVLLRTDPARINTISLQRPDGKRVVLTRQEDNWRVQQQGVHPVAVPADGDVVKSLLDATQLIASAALVKNSTPEAANEFGLTHPQSTLIVDDAKIEFGTKPSFDAGKVYARVTSRQTKGAPGGVQVALVSAMLADFPSKPFDDWRDKSILRIKPIEVSQLKVHAPVVNASFERTALGGENELDKWKVTTPVAASADAGTIVTLLQELQSTKSVKFLEDNPQDSARWGLTKPWIALDLMTDGGARSLKIGKKVSGGRAAQNSFSNAVFVVPDTLLPVINRPLRDWRDRAFLKFDKSQIETVQVTARGRSATFENVPSNTQTPWKRTDAGAAATSPKIASQNMLDVSLGLDGLKAQDFIDAPSAPNAYGFDRPTLEINLTSSEWNGIKKLQLGEKDGKMYARIGDGNQFDAPVYEVATSTLNGFVPALDSLFPQPVKKKM
jgi:hypothetical protein